LTLQEVGAIAHRAGVALSLLAPERNGIEDAFLDIVGEGGQP
jgi:ABC-2 type transport system ATP-binding protein